MLLLYTFIYAENILATREYKQIQILLSILICFYYARTHTHIFECMDMCCYQL